MQTATEYLHIFLDMGDALLSSGAEIFRVEDTLNRMGYAAEPPNECICDYLQHCHYYGIPQQAACTQTRNGYGKMAETILPDWNS